MIRIITVEREFGAGSASIAKALAERLHWKLWDEALTSEIALWRRRIHRRWNGWKSAWTLCFIV